MPAAGDQPPKGPSAAETGSRRKDSGPKRSANATMSVQGAAFPGALEEIMFQLGPGEITALSVIIAVVIVLGVFLYLKQR